MSLSKIGFGGGCHWCTEAVFQSLKGVDKVDQGWIASDGKNDSFSEAVIVHFDSGKIKLKDLILVHLETHSSSSSHSFRDKYRSAIYFFNDLDKINIDEILIDISKEKGREFITKAFPFIAFKENKEDYKSYFLKNPDKAFCKRYISPKLDQLKLNHSEIMKYE